MTTAVGSEADAEGSALSRPGYGVELVLSVLAAIDLGFFRDEGVNASLELLAPPSRLLAALRNGELDLVAGGASDTLSAFPGWRGAKSTDTLRIIKGDAVRARAPRIGRTSLGQGGWCIPRHLQRVID